MDGAPGTERKTPRAEDSRDTTLNEAVFVKPVEGTATTPPHRDDRPTAPFRAATSVGRAAWWLGTLLLGLSITVNSVVVLLPLLLLLFMGVEHGVAILAAESLQHSGGLARSTFDDGFALGTGVVAAAGLWSLVRFIASDKDPAEPVAWGCLPLLVGLLTLAADLLSWVDIPDTLTTAGVLGSLLMFEWLTPLFGIGMLLLMGLAWFDEGRRSPTTLSHGLLRHGMVTALVLLGLGLWSWLSDDPAPATPQTAAIEASDFGARLVPSQGALHDRLSELAAPERFFEPSPEVASSAPTAFTQCAEALSTPLEDFEGKTVVATAQLVMLNKGMSRHDAHDMVLDLLLRVCERHAKQPLRGVVEYFLKALNYGRCDWRAGRGRYRRHRPLDEHIEATCTTLNPLSIEARADVERILATLDDGDRHLIWLRFVDGLKPREIAPRLGVSANTVSQRVRRALRRARKAL